MSGLFTMPPSLVAPVTVLLDSVSLALAQANGTVDNIGAVNAALIQANAAAVVTAATPLLNAADPEISYMAQASATTATLIGALVQHPIVAPFQSIQVINPNMPALAAQYLGDANRWQDIAQFNIGTFGNIPDPLPVGSFLINIPNPNTTPVANP